MSHLRASLIAFFALLSLARAQETRSYNLLDGRSINARIIEADDGKVVLERTDKLTFTLEPKSFSPDDQARIREWRIADRLEKGTLFKLGGESVAQEPECQDEEGLSIRFWQAGYVVQVENASTLDLEDVTLTYSFQVQRASIAQPQADAEPQPPETVSRTVQIKDLPGGKPLSFPTPTVRLRSAELEEGWTWPGGGDKPVTDTLSPLTATLTFRDQEVVKVQIKPTAADNALPQDKTSTAPAEAEQ